MTRLLASLLALLLGAAPAFAGSGTITVLDSGSSVRTYDVITDGSGHFVSQMGICDGAAAAQCAAVKAASTAAGATDPAMVVVVSPNNSVAITAASLPLPTSAATSALQTTGNTALTTINTTLGSPMQATGGTVTANAGTNLNTSALATSANLTSGTQKTQIVDGSGNVIASTSNNLDVQCANCSGSGVSTADEATFTAGTSLFAGTGGFFQTTATSNPLTNGQQGMLQLTAQRAAFVNPYQWAGVTLGATGVTTYGSTPAAVNVPAVNAFVTNATALGQAVMASSSPVVIASDQSSVPVTPLSTTNAGATLVKGGVGVVNGGSRYQAVAASQTATVLQSSTGAAGDYLSHCVIYPQSTSPGVVTVFDGSNSAPNSAILFAGGASSLSNLAPIPMPVGAISRNGAWEVTTGANVSVVCYGSFS